LHALKNWELSSRVLKKLAGDENTGGGKLVKET
jgi:hypothetical protein